MKINPMMNMRNLFAAAGLALTVAAAQQAGAQQTTITNTDWSVLSYDANDALVPDGNFSGLALSRDVEGFSGPITDLRVTLTLAGGWNGDLYAYLVHGSGFAVLLNRIGVTGSNPFGFGDAGMSVTFSDDAAAGDIHLFGSNGGLPLSGEWQPDGRNVDPTTVLDLSSRTAMLDSFNGLDPNGTWTLFIADLSGGGQTVVKDWGIAIPTPEPTSLCLISGVLAWLWIRRRNRLPKVR